MSWNPGSAWLFCPADRPERWAKAAAVADVVIIDLEDAVPPGAKSAAREMVRGADLDPDRTVLRINAAASSEHDEDVALLADLNLRRVMLAKAEYPADVAALGDHELLLLVESPLGVERVGDLACSPNVVGLMWGADDLVAGLGGTSSRRDDGSYRDVARYARARTLVAAKAHGRLAIDAVHMDIADVDGLRTECEDAVAVGFDATVAIHPSQVPVIRAAYTPDEERVQWARRLLTAVGEARGVSTFEGRMVDGPIYRQAERILRLATTRRPAPTGRRRGTPREWCPYRPAKGSLRNVAGRHAMPAEPWKVLTAPLSKARARPASGTLPAASSQRAWIDTLLAPGCSMRTTPAREAQLIARLRSDRQAFIGWWGRTERYRRPGGPGSSRGGSLQFGPSDASIGDSPPDFDGT